jgi:WhiB family transcriptional regulator, redox-sensing transcriptional regulator
VAASTAVDDVGLDVAITFRRPGDATGELTGGEPLGGGATLVLGGITHQTDWVTDAACANLGLSVRERHRLFYPKRSTPKPLINEARAICQACPVRTDCLEWALAVGDWVGIWGGKTVDERREIQRSRARRGRTALSA